MLRIKKHKGEVKRSKRRNWRKECKDGIKNVIIFLDCIDNKLQQRLQGDLMDRHILDRWTDR